MTMSELIAAFIDEAIASSQGVAEIRRSTLAERFNCVPSQINYVIETRFTPERGFSVESRRGGGGYIRITRVKIDRENLLMHVINAIGDEIDYNSTDAFLKNLAGAELINEREGKIMLSVLSDKALRRIPAPARDSIRADLLKQALVNI